MNRQLRTVDRHLRHWRESGLIGADLEDQLRASSRALDRSGVNTALRTALAVLGSVLVLAGLTLIIAENWEALHRFAKLGGWAVLLAAFLAAVLELERRFPDRPALAEAMTLTAGGWVLAGIALVSQIYHLESRPPNGIWLWLALVAPAAWLLKGRATSLVLFGALVTALALEVQDPESLIHATRAVNPWLWLAVPLTAGVLASLLPHPWPAIRSWIGGWVFVVGQVFLLVLGAAQEGADSDLGRAWILVVAGLGATLAIPSRVFSSPLDHATSRWLIGATLLPWVLVGRSYDTASLVDGLAVGAAWIAQFAVAILVIRAGARGGASGWVNVGYVALLAGIVVRYFDFFGDFLEGGAALVLTGLLLLFVVYTLEKSRRRTLVAEAA